MSCVIAIERPCQSLEELSNHIIKTKSIPSLESCVIALGRSLINFFQGMLCYRIRETMSILWRVIQLHQEDQVNPFLEELMRGP